MALEKVFPGNCGPEPFLQLPGNTFSFTVLKIELIQKFAFFQVFFRCEFYTFAMKFFRLRRRISTMKQTQKLGTAQSPLQYG